jgi:hypothetical protein
MDPNPLTKAQWADIGLTLKMLWATMFLMFIGAQLFLAAHAIIPSSVATRHLGPRWNRVRPVLYAGGFACLAGIGVAMYVIIGVVGIGNLAHTIYPKLYR